ncbi:TetR/AcrR family transcriptional regulator [Cupriavidus basilensis]|uniref:TetR/AcrR family transcriptional regulator n=1 Tax=Cupriavidus basilensis TaxID=68895 RepID=UPI0023E7BE6A|nr:TetR/AcrR family transcriptional regulator [Cupriavidus basilensis]MDF3882952.1 TetR/AcrR family transcriptional regulator [Cupriavidus basilensis]
MTAMKKSVSGAGRGRPRQFDRDEALGQALSLFWRYGYGSTSIAALTEAMAITAPSLYAAFGSKEQLFYEAVDRYADTHGALLYAPLQAAGGAREAVQGLLSGAAALFSAKGNPAGCFLMSGTSCSADCAYIEDTLRERRREKEQALQACIQHGIARGELPAGTDTAALAKFYNTVMQGMSMQARDGASRAALEAVAATAMLAWPAGPAKAPKAAKTAKSAKPRETQTT